MALLNMMQALSDSSGSLAHEGGNSSPVVVDSGGLRYITPYFHTTIHPVKLEQEGLLIGDMLAQTMDREDSSFWSSECLHGRIFLRKRKRSREDKVDFEPATPDLRVARNQKVRIVEHVHECVVAAADPRILFEDDELVAVDKPSGVPIRDNRWNRYSSVFARLQQLFPDRGYDALCPVNRLDKPVSGVWLLARSARRAQRIREMLVTADGVMKIYIAIVEGVFPHAEQVVNQPLSFGLQDDGRSRAFVDPLGKPCVTTFRRLATMQNTSLVAAMLHSGRQHQIRAHLAHLGHPIANDRLYGGSSLASGTHSAYLDAEDSALAQMVNSSFQPWCPKCRWVQDAVDGKVSRQTAGESIFLHSLQYKFVYKGRPYCISAPGPSWASDYYKSDELIDAFLSSI